MAGFLKGLYQLELSLR
jgi:hypothetical protein